MLATKQFLSACEVPFAAVELFVVVIVKIASFTLKIEAAVTLKSRCVSTRLHDVSGQKTAMLSSEHSNWKKPKSMAV
jgi:hypothetical protein